MTQREVEGVEHDGGSRSVFRLGGVLSILAGIGFVAIGVLVGMDPVERCRGHAFYEQLSKTPGIAMTWRPIFVVIGFLSIGVITAVARLVRSRDGKWEGILTWFTIMAYVGTVTQAIDWMREFEGIRQYMTLAAAGDRTAITAWEVATAWWVDPEFLWRFGALGSWYVLVGVLGAVQGRMPRGCALFGVLGGASLLLAMVFGITDTLVRIGGVQIAAMQIPSAIGGAIICPIFHVWVGLVLLRAARGERARAVQPVGVFA